MNDLFLLLFIVDFAVLCAADMCDSRSLLVPTLLFAVSFNSLSVGVCTLYLDLRVTW